MGMGMDVDAFHRSLWRCDLDAAGALLDSVHSQESGSPAYLKHRADLLHRASDFAAALELYLELGKVHPSYLWHRYPLVDACAHLGLGSLAVSELQSMVERSALPAGVAHQVFAEGWMPLGMDAEIQALDRNHSHGPSDRQMLLMMQGQSRMRSAGITAGLAEYCAGYCVPDTWRTFYPQMVSQLPSYWYGQRELPRQLIVQGRGGMGDYLQWLRYVPLLEAMGVTVQYGQALPGLQCLPVEDDRAVRALYAHGYHLGGAGTSLWTDPFTLFAALFPVVGYAAAPRYLALTYPKRTALLQAQVRRQSGGKPCVGLFWSANESPGPFGGRSLTLPHLSALLEMEDVHWVIFQRGCQRERWLLDGRSADEARFTTVPVSLSYGDSIGFASQLDVLVCIDSGLLHACAALATPCVLVGNVATEWRWESGARTGWYPTVSIVRAPRLGAWGEAVDEVGRTLGRLLEGVP